MEPKKETSPMAICSLVFGLIGIFPVAIVLGHIARSQIRKNELLEGDGMAVAGLVLGYLSLAICVLCVGAIAVLIALGSQVQHTFTTVPTIQSR